MKIKCLHCGKTMEINNLGRRPLNITVINVCDALREYGSIPTAAEKLGCSRGLVYKILKAAGLTPADVIKGHATKDNSLLHKQGVRDGRQE